MDQPKGGIFAAFGDVRRKIQSVDNKSRPGPTVRNAIFWTGLMQER